MIKTKNFTLVFIICITLFFISNVDAAKRYKYVCDNEQCYNTGYDFIGDNFYINDKDGNFKKKKIDKFTNTINNKLQDYIDYYGSDTVLIENFCEGDCTNNNDLDDREFTIEELISYNIPFHIGSWVFWGVSPNIEKSFDNGYDYLFTYFSSIIDELHSNGYPGYAKNKLTDLVGNILKYSDQNNNFELRNVCNVKFCSNSQEKILTYGDNDVYYFVSGTIKQSIQFVGDTFNVSNGYKILESGTNYDATLIKGGDTIDFVFSFEDYLDFTENETEYKYIIMYNNEGDPTSTHLQELTETIIIDNDTFYVSSDGLGDNLNNVIDVEVLDADSHQIKVSINESFKINKEGNKTFYLQADNLTSGDSFPTTQINTFPLEVIASDDVTNSVGLINNFSLIGNIDGYGRNKPFMVTLNLLDVNGNYNVDEIDGYEISLSSGNSEFMELSNDGTEASDWGKIITGITTDSNKQVKFYFRLTEPGYYDLNGFDFKVREKNDLSNYSTPETYNELKNVVPGNLFDVDNTRVKINIVSPPISDLPIVCGRDVIVDFTCTSDNLSGCHSPSDTHYDFDSESDNGTPITLEIRDNAFNWRIYSGIVNHVDTTAPGIEIFKGINELTDFDYDYLASSDDLILKFDESVLSNSTTENCKADLSYELDINGSHYLSGSILFLDQTLTIPGFFTGAFVDKKLDIKITDSYGNANTKSIKFNIYPDFWESSFILNSISTNGVNYANNLDEYEYHFTMKDQFGNPIYGKTIESIEQSNNGTTGNFYSLKLNENNNGEIDTPSGITGLSTALIPEFTGTSALDGSYSFKLRSLTPGKFTEKFNVKIKKWKNDYNDYSNDFQIINIGNSSFTNNSFKKPIVGTLTVDGTDIPAINTDYKFNITLSNTGNLTNISNGELVLNKDSVINNTVGHYWETNSFKVIGSKNFSLSDMNLSFSGTVDASSNYTSAISIGFNELKIVYKLGGKLVSYFIDQSDLGGGCDVETLGLKVYGTLEGEGKASDVGQNENFSDLSKGVLRGEIRKNAFILSKNMSSDKTKNINGIIYVEGEDVKYSEVKSTLNFNDTIIIKNGNLIIDENIDTNIGIIVLKSNYNVMSDYNIEGNIYVNKDVTEINAIIYADGAFRSANDMGYTYSDSELDNQLKFNGSLFTRNTIGGSIGQNTLPGGKIITLSSEYYLANIYDLNNIRKQILTCAGDEDSYAFIIRYNPSIQINPPKGFDIK